MMKILSDFSHETNNFSGDQNEGKKNIYISLLCYVQRFKLKGKY